MQQIKLPKLKKLGEQLKVDIEGYIPRDQRKKILMLSDDIRTHSGVGGMAREIIINSSHHFNWVNLGGAVKHPDAGKGFDMSSEINTLLKIPEYIFY